MFSQDCEDLQELGVTCREIVEVGRFVTYLPVLYCAISPLGPLDYIHVYFGGITNLHTCTYSYSLHVHLFGLFNVLLHFFYFMKLF